MNLHSGITSVGTQCRIHSCAIVACNYCVQNVGKLAIIAACCMQ